MKLWVSRRGTRRHPYLVTGAPAEPKLRQAGVDRVVNAHEIGGSRMAALVLQPDVVEFLDVVMHDEELEVHLEETRVVSGDPYAGRALSACKIAESTGATVLAVRRNESFVTNPPDHFVLAADDVLIVLGTRGQLAELNSEAGAGARAEAEVPAVVPGRPRGRGRFGGARPTR